MERLCCLFGYHALATAAQLSGIFLTPPSHLLGLGGDGGSIILPAGRAKDKMRKAVKMTKNIKLNMKGGVGKNDTAPQRD
jgi:hypothetical protein